MFGRFATTAARAGRLSTVARVSAPKVNTPSVNAFQWARFNSSSTKLSGFLQVEFEQEQDPVTPADEILGNSPFKVDTSASKGSYFVLRNGNATVEFDAKELEHDGEETLAVPFEVIITKDSINKELIFDCIGQYIESSQDGELLLESIVLQDVKPAGDDESKYSPSFPELDDNLQESFFDYLHEHGVDEHFARSVVLLADSTESTLYRSWLSSVKGFVDAK